MDCAILKDVNLLRHSPPNACRWSVGALDSPARWSGVALRASTAVAAGEAGPAPSGQPPSPSSSSSKPEFDWKLGVALGGCSFEAYNEPETGNGLPETTPSGSRIVYTDKDFLVKKMMGLLELTIRSATNLPAADIWPGKSDPYCIVQIGDSSCTTQVVNSNLNPVWDETFTLYIRDSTQRLVVRVLDQDMGKADDFLGSSMRGIADLLDGREHRVSLSLRGPKGNAGEVHLEARFLPFTDVLAGEASSSKMGGPALGSPGWPLLARMPEMHLDTGAPSPWKELAQLAGVAVHSMFTPLCFIENTVTDSQAWFMWSHEERRVCVAFRGTEQAKWKDLLTDLSLVPSSLDPERVKGASRNTALAEESMAPNLLQRVVSGMQEARKQVEARRAVRAQQQEASSSGGPNGSSSPVAAELEEQEQLGMAGTVAAAVKDTAEELSGMLEHIRQTIEQAQAEAVPGKGQDDEMPWVHHGFLLAYDSIRPQVLSIMDTLLAGEEGEGERPWSVYISGHSLGGALATLCAYDLALRLSRRPNPPNLALYNFGSPRVGNKAFAEEFNRLVPDAWRVVNRNDAVCTVPRLMGYCHVGHAVKLKEGGDVEVQLDTSDVLGEGIAVPEVLPKALPKLTEKVLEKVGVEVALAASNGEGDGAAAVAALSSRQVEDLLEQEMEAWRLLLSGSSVSEHMEDLYLESLRAFAEAMSQAEDR